MSTDSTQSPSAYCLVHLNAGGALDPTWSSNGRVFSDFPSTMVRGGSTAIGDGFGGAYVQLVLTGGQPPTGEFTAGESRLYHVLGDAGDDPDWPAGGLWLGPAVAPGLDGNLPRCDLATDGAGGIYAAWREPTTPDYSFLRRVLATGALDPAWPAPERVAFIRNGMVLADAQGVFVGGWGFTVTCIHQTNCFGVTDIGRRSSDGSIPQGWEPTGPPFMPSGGVSALGWMGPSSMAPDGAGGAYVAWTDDRGIVSVMRFLQQGPIAGVAPAGPGTLALTGARFTSAGVRVTVGGLAERAGELAVYDLLGRKVAVVRVLAGTSSTVVPGTGELHSGLYFLRIRTAVAEARTRVLVAR